MAAFYRFSKTLLDNVNIHLINTSVGIWWGFKKLVNIQY